MEKSRFCNIQYGWMNKRKHKNTETHPAEEKKPWKNVIVFFVSYKLNERVNDVNVESPFIIKKKFETRYENYEKRWREQKKNA